MITVTVHICSTHLEPISLTDDLINADDALMADLTNMQEPDSAIAQIQESTIWPQALYNTLNDISNLQGWQSSTIAI